MLSTWKKVVIGGCSALTVAATGFLIYTFFIKNISYCTVTFDTQGAVNCSNSWTAKVKKGGSLTKPNIMPLKNGYKFIYWSDGLSAWNFNDNVVTSDMTLTAKYAMETYTIDLTSGVATSTSYTKTMTYDITTGEITLPVLVATNSNYEFTGWKLKEAPADAEDAKEYVSEESFEDSQHIYTIPAGTFGNMDLVGNWVENA